MIGTTTGRARMKTGHLPGEHVADAVGNDDNGVMKRGDELNKKQKNIQWRISHVVLTGAAPGSWK